jgi:hypothetical protein
MTTIIGRHVGETTLNGLEFLCDHENNTLEFRNEEEAKTFLREVGCTEEDIDSFEYVDLEGDGDGKGED